MNFLQFDRKNLPQHIRDHVLKNKKNPTLVEVGSFEGEYAKCIFDAFPECEMFLVDMWETKGNDFYYSIREGTVEKAYEVAIKRFKEIDNVELLKGRSEEVVSSFKDETIDFIYIDADHSYEGCLKDLRLWYPKVKKGGVIAGHDWDCDPRMQEFHKFGVEAAVREFFFEKLNEIMLTNEQFHKSWVLIK